MPPAAPTICAVVAGGDAARAIERQTRPPDDVLVMAGAARERLRAALERGTEWIWLIEPDVVPAPAALEELLAPLALGGELPAPALFTSKVVGGDGRLDPESASWPRGRGEEVIAAARHRLVALRLARWGSLLVHRDALQRNGLPPVDTGPRGDDLHWSSCVLATGHGYLVPRSLASRSRAGSSLSADEVRARVGMIPSGCWTRAERVRFAFRVIDDAASELGAGPRGRTLATLARGSVTGLAAGLRQRRGRDGLHAVAQPSEHHGHAVAPESGPA